MEDFEDEAGEESKDDVVCEVVVGGEEGGGFSEVSIKFCVG